MVWIAPVAWLAWIRRLNESNWGQPPSFRSRGRCCAEPCGWSSTKRTSMLRRGMGWWPAGSVGPLLPYSEYAAVCLPVFALGKVRRNDAN